PLLIELVACPPSLLGFRRGVRGKAGALLTGLPKCAQRRLTGPLVTLIRRRQLIDVLCDQRADRGAPPGGKDLRAPDHLVIELHGQVPTHVHSLTRGPRVKLWTEGPVRRTRNGGWRRARAGAAEGQAPP